MKTITYMRGGTEALFTRGEILMAFLFGLVLGGAGMLIVELWL